MKLPHLTQTLELARGEAAVLEHHIVSTLRQLLVVGECGAPRRARPGDLLALGPLDRVRRRLAKRVDWERANPPKARMGPFHGRKPENDWKLRLAYDELVALHCHLATNHDCFEVRAVQGKIQQKALNLEPYVDFT